MKKRLVVLGYFLIMVGMLAYIAFSFLVAYYVNAINENQEMIKERDMGRYSYEWSKNINTTEINKLNSIFKDIRDFANTCLWGSILLLVMGVIAITYGCVKNPNLKDILDILISIGVISFVFGIIFVSLGYFYTLQMTPIGYNEIIDAWEKRLSDDFLTGGVILLFMGANFFVVRKKLKVNILANATR